MDLIVLSSLLLGLLFNELVKCSLGVPQTWSYYPASRRDDSRSLYAPNHSYNSTDRVGDPVYTLLHLVPFLEVTDLNSEP